MAIFYVRAGDADKVLTVTLGAGVSGPTAIPAGAVVTFVANLRGERVTGTAVADADQTAHPGKITFQMEAATLESITPGWWEVNWKVELIGGQIDTYPLGGFDTLVVEPPITAGTLDDTGHYVQD